MDGRGPGLARLSLGIEQRNSIIKAQSIDWTFPVGEIGLEPATSRGQSLVYFVPCPGSGRSGSRERGNGMYSTEGRRWAV
jgi:hypothetical protein